MQQNRLSDLPDEILLINILSELNTRDLLSVARVNLKFNKLVQDKSLSTAFEHSINIDSLREALITGANNYLDKYSNQKFSFSHGETGILRAQIVKKLCQKATSEIAVLLLARAVFSIKKFLTNKPIALNQNFIYPLLTENKVFQLKLLSSYKNGALSYLDNLLLIKVKEAVARVYPATELDQNVKRIQMTLKELADIFCKYLDYKSAVQPFNGSLWVFNRYNDLISLLLRGLTIEMLLPPFSQIEKEINDLTSLLRSSNQSA